MESVPEFLKKLLELKNQRWQEQTHRGDWTKEKAITELQRLAYSLVDQGEGWSDWLALGLCQLAAATDMNDTERLVQTVRRFMNDETNTFLKEKN